VNLFAETVLCHLIDFCMPLAAVIFLSPCTSDTYSQGAYKLKCCFQEQVNAAATFPDVLRDMEKWMKSHRLGKDNRFALVTDGQVLFCAYSLG